MQSTTPFITLLVLASFFTGCSFFEPDAFERPSPSIGDRDLSTNASLLVGEWEWLHTYNIWGPEVTYAHQVDRTVRLVFDADSAFEYHNGELEWSGTYQTDNGGLEFESRYSTSFGVNEEHLVLSNAALDGPERAFQRTE